MKILAVHRYYWPDTPPYAAMLRRIVGRWKQDGHCIEILSSQPSYKAELNNQRRPSCETIDGIVVRRLSLPNETGRTIVRLINAIRLSVFVICKALIHRYDVIMISTVPPLIGGAAAAFAAKLTRARFIYHCMDIHPEVGKLSGEFSNPLIFKPLLKLDNWTCRQANPVVVLSKDMKRTLRQRFNGDRFTIKVLNNFSLPSANIIPNDLPLELLKTGLTVLFAGNIGRFQGLDIVVEAMAKIKDRDDIEFIFMGEGSAKIGLLKMAKAMGAKIRFLGHQPVEIAKAVMQKVDAGFVSLTRGMYRYAYPSKTMTYLEQGCPLIVAVEPESDLYRDVERRQYGYCVPAGDYHALADLLVHLADDPFWRSKMKKKARQMALTTFAEPVILNEWSKMLYFRKERHW